MTDDSEPTTNAHRIVTSHRPFALVVIAMSILIPAIPVAVLVFGGFPIWALAVPFVVVTLPLLTWGLSIFFTTSTFDISQREVCMERSSFFGRNTWNRPLDKFTLMTTVTYGRNEVEHLTSRYTVMLVTKKPGSDHEVELFSTDDREVATAEMTQFAKKFPVKVDERLFDYNLGRPVKD